MSAISGKLFNASSASEGFEALLPFEGQAQASTIIQNPTAWASNVMGVCAPHKSGLTALLTAWQARMDATYLLADDASALNQRDMAAMSVRPIVVDDCHENCDEAALLSLFNVFKQTRQKLLLGTHHPFNTWTIASKDLASRLVNLESVTIAALSETSARAWLGLLAKRWHIKMPETAINYVLNYIDLDYARLHTLIVCLDAEYASQDKPISRYAVKAIAEHQGWLKADGFT